jgi:hypothetical protein
VKRTRPVFGLSFDRRIKPEFHGSKVTFGGGLLAFRELDDALGLSAMAGDALADKRSIRSLDVHGGGAP